MQIAKHLEKGFWAIAIQMLIALYGVAFMFLVVRVLPEEEYGNFVLIQMAFLITAQLGTGFAFGPLVKYLYEYQDRKILLTNTLFLGMAFYLLSGFIIWILRAPLGSLLNSVKFTNLAFFVPVLLIASFGKFFTNQLQRGLYHIKGIFWTDLAYHATALVLISYYTFSSRLASAFQMLWILVTAFVISSWTGIWLVRDQLKLTWRFDLSCLKTLFNYGKYVLGSVVNSQIYERLDVFMIAAFVGPVEVAVYHSAKLFVRIIEMYRQAINLLAFPLFSKLHSEKRLKDIKAVYEKGILFSHVLLVPLSIVLIIFAEELFRFVYAGKYLDGVIILQLLALTGPLLAWQVVGEGLLYGLGFPQISFGARTATTVTKVILNLVLISLWQSVGAAVASVVSMSILALVVTRGVKSKIEFSFYGILSRFNDIKNFIKLTKLQLKGVKLL